MQVRIHVRRVMVAKVYLEEIVATLSVELDERASPPHGELVDFVSFQERPGETLMKFLFSPGNFFSQRDSGNASLNASTYVKWRLMPLIDLTLQLVRARMATWYTETPRLSFIDFFACETRIIAPSKSYLTLNTSIHEPHYIHKRTYTKKLGRGVW